MDMALSQGMEVIDRPTKQGVLIDLRQIAYIHVWRNRRKLLHRDV